MCHLSAVIVQPGSVRLHGGEVIAARTAAPAGSEVTLIVRPEKLHLYASASDAPSGRNALKGSVLRRTFYGESMEYEVQMGPSGSVEVRVENVPSAHKWHVGDQVVVDFHNEAAMALTE